MEGIADEHASADSTSSHVEKAEALSNRAQTMELEVISRLRAALIASGVPEGAIDDESNIRLNNRASCASVIRCDMVIVDDATETPIAAFEVKSGNGGLHKAYEVARKHFYSVLQKKVACFVVALASNGDVMIAPIMRRRWSDANWRSLSDRKGVQQLLDEANVAKKLGAESKESEQELAKFRWWMCFVGIATVVTVALSESWGMEYSWKVYSLIGVLFALYAASYGVPIKLKMGGCEVSLIHKKNAKVD